MIIINNNSVAKSGINNAYSTEYSTLITLTILDKKGVKDCEFEIIGSSKNASVPVVTKVSNLISTFTMPAMVDGYGVSFLIQAIKNGEETSDCAICGVSDNGGVLPIPISTKYEIYEYDSTDGFKLDLGWGENSNKRRIKQLSGAASGDLSQNYPNPTVVDLTISGEVQGSVLYYNGSNWVQLSPGTSGYFLKATGAGSNPLYDTLIVSPTGAASGDLLGSFPSPTVVDLTITSEAQGSVLYFNGSNWVQLSPGTAGTFLKTNGVAANPTWSSVSVNPSGAASGDLSGSFPSPTLADDAVTFAKFQQIATDKLVGRDTSGTGNVEEIGLQATLSFTGSQAIQRAALTGDVTASAGSNSTVVAKIDGYTVNTKPTANGQVLTYNGTNLDYSTSFQTLSDDVTGAVAANTLEKIRDKTVTSATPRPTEQLAWDATNSTFKFSNLFMNSRVAIWNDDCMIAAGSSGLTSTKHLNNNKSAAFAIPSLGTPTANHPGVITVSSDPTALSAGYNAVYFGDLTNKIYLKTGTILTANFKTKTLSGTYSTYFGFMQSVSTSGGTDNFLIFHTATGGSIDVSGFKASSQTISGSVGTASANTWYQYVITVDASNIVFDVYNEDGTRFGSQQTKSKSNIDFTIPYIPCFSGIGSDTNNRAMFDLDKMSLVISDVNRGIFS